MDTFEPKHLEHRINFHKLYLSVIIRIHTFTRDEL